jgi:hypothetical protein
LCGVGELLEAHRLVAIESVNVAERRVERRTVSLHRPAVTTERDDVVVASDECAGDRGEVIDRR